MVARREKRKRPLPALRATFPKGEGVFNVAWSPKAFHSRRSPRFGGRRPAKPDEASAPAFSFTDERALRPLDVRAGWVLAETLDKKHRGWLQTEWVCGNPVTTCP